MKRSSRHFESSTPLSVEVSPLAMRSFEFALYRWQTVHGDAPSRLPAALARVLAALAIHPYLGVARGRERQLALAAGYYAIYRVFPRKRLVTIVRLLHESELYTSGTTRRR